MRTPSVNHSEMQDNDERASDRGATPFYMHNRKERRKLAKSFKLFKGQDRSSWRRANQHMASEAQKQLRFGEDLKHGEKRNN